MPITLETDPGVLRLQLNRATSQLVEKDDEIARLEAKVKELAIALHDSQMKLREALANKQ